MNDPSVSRRNLLIATRAGAVFVSADEDVDAKPVLVLLPSGGHSRHDWDAVRPALSARFRTVALDWPGHGDSPMPIPGWVGDSDGFADLVEDVIDHVTDGPVALAGNSVGGFAAARFALRHPHRTWALVLVDSGGFIPLTPKVRMFNAAMGRPWFLRAIYPWFAHWYMRADTAAAKAVETAAVQIATSPDTSQLLSVLWRGFSEPTADLLGQADRIGAPTLVVWGKRDPVLPVKLGRALADMLPDGRLAVIDAGHVPAVSRPTEFVDAVRPFLTTASGVAR